ncbi:MAG: RNA polymerase sigma factor [Gemmatimonadaceae bacterium]
MKKVGLLTQSDLDDFRMGDERCLARLHAAHSPVLRRRLQIFCPVLGYDDVTDLVQETWIRAWHNRAELAGPASMDGWLWRICRNLTVDTIRERRRLMRGGENLSLAIKESLTHVPEDVAIRRGLADQAAYDWINDQILRLPRLQLRVAALHWLLGWNIAHTAEFLCVAPGTVKSSLQRVRATLRLAARSPDIPDQ